MKFIKNVYELTSLLTISSIMGGTLLSSAVPAQAAENHSVKGETATPIQHVVVLFQENVSFDHYFGTYPKALNPAGEPAFYAKPGTPAVNGLTDQLLNHNANLFNPQRLDRTQPITSSQNHGYYAEQAAFDGGKMDMFVQKTGGGKSTVMDYYDGNTVTALWNYAQNYSLNDNSYNTQFGPSTPGAVNLISGNTSGATVYQKGNIATGATPMTTNAGGVENNTIIGDPDPYYDNASTATGNTASLSGKNVGDLMNQKNVTWGWFEGGFRNPSATTPNANGTPIRDYSPHHQPFQYYASTSNPNHLAPTSVDSIGKQDQANHQYDLTDFWAAAESHNLPAVSFLKAPAAQDGHPGNSGPLDEQKFIVNTINHLQQLPEWKNTAVVIAYDDSDGWYDHQQGPSLNLSNPDRNGYGPRTPLLVISAYAKQNFVDHTVTDQTSILRFIEDNWRLGRIGNGSVDAQAGSLLNMFNFDHANMKKLILDPTTGEVVKQSDDQGQQQGQQEGQQQEQQGQQGQDKQD